MVGDSTSQSGRAQQAPGRARRALPLDGTAQRPQSGRTTTPPVGPSKSATTTKATPKATTTKATPQATTKTTAAQTASTSARPRTGGKPRRPKTRGQRIRQVLLWTGVAVVALMIAGIALVAMYYSKTTLPNPNADFTTQTTTLYYRDGTTKLGTLAVQNRQPLTVAEMPDNVKNAVLAAEDRTFWSNPGISVPGMVRAGMRVLTGGDLQSGSTLTQQYIKVLYLTSEQTMSRKVKELVLAVKMTNQMPKDQILTDYLNTVYFGRGAYGVEAASKAFFNVDAKDLNVQQAAVLACLVNSPAAYDPSKSANLPALTARYDYVLDGMVEMGTLTPSAADVLKGSLPTFPDIPVSNRYGGPEGFLITMAEQELIDAGLTQAQISGGGLSIVTTFDAALQNTMQQTAVDSTAQVAALAEPPQDPSQLHIAMASVQVGTGEVLALYGGPDYVANQRNWATTPRPVGSTFKPYAFIAGERGGFSLKSLLQGNAFTPKGDKTKLTNSGNTNYGHVSLLKATEQSINTAFVDLVQRLPGGPDAVVKAAQDAGLTPSDAWDASNRIPLGTSEVSPLAQAGAYATFANYGARAKVHCVVSATDPSGTRVYTGDTSVEQTIEPDIAADLNYALESVVDEGTAVAAKALGVPTAGKTGTVQVDSGAITASWYVGYTRSVATSVMYVVGDSGTGALDPYKPPSKRLFYASGYPLQTWLGYMTQAVVAYPGSDFEPRANVNGNGTEPGKITPSPTPTPGPEPEQPAPPPDPVPQPEPTTETQAQPPAEPTTDPTTDPTTTPAPPTTPAVEPTPAPG